MTKEERREYNRKYYQANKERLKEQLKQYRKEYYKEYRNENAEKIKEYNKEYWKQYRKDNAERIKEQNKEYYKDNAEHYKQYYKEYNKQYLQTPMGRALNLLRAYNQADKKYNRGKGNLTAKWIVENIFSQPCHYNCGESDWKKMGCDRIDNSKPHTMDNVVPCCAECNIKRGNKTYEEFLADN